MFETDRTRRVAELIKRQLAMLIMRELNDSRINSVSVTGVTVSRDLKQSTVYVSTLDKTLEPRQIEQLLNRSSKYLRHLLSQQVDLKMTPKLVFEYDHSLQRGVELTQLIDKLNNNNAA
ncbi:30S ribosome-binding factor RbfA [Candidatus Spongiihabitans sp.]|uniref:30S ribosome-binding factor RbfA n=1 Tax=Candidatus Spongiihabitans sp. TaxID=3101308 RepID=UPI003C7C24F3